MEEEIQERQPMKGHYHAQVVVKPEGAGVKISKEVSGNQRGSMAYEVIKYGGVLLDPNNGIYDNFKMLHGEIIKALPDDRIYLNVSGKNNILNAKDRDESKKHWIQVSVMHDIRFKTKQALLLPDDVEKLIKYSNKAQTEGATLWENAKKE